MFYNKQASEDYRKAQKKIDFEKIGSMIAVGVGYQFGGLAMACVVGLIVVIYSLCEIQKLINYQNFMKEKEIGLHDLNG